MSDDSGVLWRRSPDVAFVDDGERVVVFDLIRPDNDTPRLLSGPAADVWRLLEQPAHPEAIVSALVHRYELPRSAIEADVRAFIARLAGLKMLAPTGGLGEGDGLRDKHVV